MIECSMRYTSIYLLGLEIAFCVALVNSSGS